MMIGAAVASDVSRGRGSTSRVVTRTCLEAKLCSRQESNLSTHKPKRIAPIAAHWGVRKRWDSGVAPHHMQVVLYEKVSNALFLSTATREKNPQKRKRSKIKWSVVPAFAVSWAAFITHRWGSGEETSDKYGWHGSHYICIWIKKRWSEPGRTLASVSEIATLTF